jgi:ribulose-phosphate 3-epimerase
MYRGIELSASLMCIDWLQAGQQLKEIEPAVDYLHLDVVDGIFAPDFTMGSSIIECFRKNSSLAGDYHLMVEEPSRVLHQFPVREGDNFAIHQEASKNLHRDLMAIKKQNLKAGVAIAPATSLQTLEYILEDLDFVNVMAVNPGFKGQSLVAQSIRKIADLRKMILAMRVNVKISVDGNVNPLTIPDMVSAGADRLVLGSSGLFRKDLSLDLAIKEVYRAIDLGLQRRDAETA